MAEGRRKENWSHTSSILAMLANVNRCKGRAFTPDDFNPMVKRAPAEAMTIADLREQCKALKGASQ